MSGTKSLPSVLTIAGSDPSGGAGIQADIKTITVHKVYAMSAITALTAQNTTGVYGIFDIPKEFVEKQIDCVFEDIFPDAVKIGMVSSGEIIGAIVEKLTKYRAENIVVDPVMVSSTGGRLLSADAEKALVTRLLKIGTIITPNIHEAEVLCGFAIGGKKDMENAARKISEFTSAGILIKGGHLSDSADDLFYENGKPEWFAGEKIDNPNTHGTGCTLSSAIACNLALGHGLCESVSLAKKYVAGALSTNFSIGKGIGPLKHTYNI